MTETIYAIGDIHGQRALLEEALSRIEADGGKDANIVFLGDYVDRGPDSKGVIDILCEGLAAGRNWTCIKGKIDVVIFSICANLYLLSHQWLGYHIVFFSYFCEICARCRGASI